ncbi:MAG: dihydrofolate reductase [Nanoarchaeota archaeon]|nr:dihydrofolate reductase [Nanoarchaeota archaeon]
MSYRLVVAVAANGVIGKSGQKELPWPRIKEDMSHFRLLTMGRHVVMGRKTWETLGKPLPGRINIILSRSIDLLVPSDVKVFHDSKILREYLADKPADIIGGAAIYQEFLSDCSEMEVTEIRKAVDGDIYFPLHPITPESGWVETSRKDHGDFSFVSYHRR